MFLNASLYLIISVSFKYCLLISNSYSIYFLFLLKLKYSRSDSGFIFLAQNIVSNQNCKKSSRRDGDHWQTAHNVYHVFGTRLLQHNHFHFAAEQRCHRSSLGWLQVVLGPSVTRVQCPGVLHHLLLAARSLINTALCCRRARRQLGPPARRYDEGW